MVEVNSHMQHALDEARKMVEPLKKLADEPYPGDSRDLSGLRLGKHDSRFLIILTNPDKELVEVEASYIDPSFKEDPTLNLVKSVTIHFSPEPNIRATRAVTFNDYPYRGQALMSETLTNPGTEFSHRDGLVALAILRTAIKYSAQPRPEDEDVETPARAIARVATTPVVQPEVITVQPKKRFARLRSLFGRN